MTFWLGFIAFTAFAYVLRRPIAGLIQVLVLILLFIGDWLYAAIIFGIGLWCLSGNSAMIVTRVCGGLALLHALYTVANAVGMFISETPDMQDTTLGARFATRDELRRAGLLRRSLDV